MVSRYHTLTSIFYRFISNLLHIIPLRLLDSNFVLCIGQGRTLESLSDFKSRCFVPPVIYGPALLVGGRWSNLKIANIVHVWYFPLYDNLLSLDNLISFY